MGFPLERGSVEDGILTCHWHHARFDPRAWPASSGRNRGESLEALPSDVETIRTALLEAFDGQRQVDLAARLVARHLKLGYSPKSLFATLARYAKMQASNLIRC